MLKQQIQNIPLNDETKCSGCSLIISFHLHLYAKKKKKFELHNRTRNWYVITDTRLSYLVSQTFCADKQFTAISGSAPLFMLHIMALRCFTDPMGSKTMRIPTNMINPTIQEHITAPLAVHTTVQSQLKSCPKAQKVDKQTHTNSGNNMNSLAYRHFDMFLRGQLSLIEPLNEMKT